MASTPVSTTISRKPPDTVSEGGDGVRYPCSVEMHSEATGMGGLDERADLVD